MDNANLVLDYLKVILTWPVMFALVTSTVVYIFRDVIKALVQRIALIKFPGGTEVSTPQSNRLATEDSKAPPEPPRELIHGLPLDLTQEQNQVVEQLVRSHIAIAYLWEYRYLNYYLARGTQIVLDWFSGLSEPTTYALYDTFWLPLIPSAVERQAIFIALQSHHLIFHDPQTNLMTVSPKGLEYRAWRGELPKLEQGESA